MRVTTLLLFWNYITNGLQMVDYKSILDELGMDGLYKVSSLEPVVIVTTQSVLLLTTHY